MGFEAGIWVTGLIATFFIGLAIAEIFGVKSITFSIALMAAFLCARLLVLEKRDL